MIYNEAYEERRQLEEALVKKWEKALKVNNIADEHTARTTAILLENYMTHLNDNPQLIAEDQVQTSAFTGVNLALLGLIARAIPQLVGLELVGTQAMPTPTSPIFTLRWYKSNAKGQTAANEEMWVSPIPAAYPVGIDPYFSSQQIRSESITPMAAASWVGGWFNTATPRATLPLLFTGTTFVNLYDTNGTLLTRYGWLTQDLNSTGGPFTASLMAGYTALDGGASLTMTIVANTSRTIASTGGNFNALTVGGTAVVTATVDYEYRPEDESIIPEI